MLRPESVNRTWATLVGGECSCRGELSFQEKINCSHLMFDVSFLWHSGKNTRFPPMWPKFDSRTGRQMWVLSFFVSLFPCLFVCLFVSFFLSFFLYLFIIVYYFPPRYSSSMKSLSNKFMHLTNYSINKKNEGAYQANSDETVCQGHKWYFEQFLLFQLEIQGLGEKRV